GAVELATVGRRRSRRWPRRGVAIALLLGFGAMAVDGTNALLYDLRVIGLPYAYTPDLRLRLATGTLAGVAMAFALVPALAQALETWWDNRRTGYPWGAETAERPGWRDAVLALAAAAGASALVASGWSLLLTPLALLGAAGVLLALLLVNQTLLAAAAVYGFFPQLGSPRSREWVLGALAASLALGELVGLGLLRHLAGG
ncbi:MAG TPA: hypothetical protein VF916_08150, partial [Ktedonobacterales bacterium]